jgi:hypothetical protein
MGYRVSNGMEIFRKSVNYLVVFTHFLNRNFQRRSIEVGNACVIVCHAY